VYKALLYLNNADIITELIKDRHFAVVAGVCDYDIRYAVSPGMHRQQLHRVQRRELIELEVMLLLISTCAITAVYSVATNTYSFC
jgi:Component of IIS longevity pathway SMK-1